MLKNKTIAIIGAGHLGSALAHGFIKSGHPKNSIICSNRNPSKLERLVNELGVLIVKSNIEAARDADILILAVKPQFMQAVCQEIAPIVQKKQPIIISLAGVTNIDNICRWLESNDQAIVRVMTNTPTEFGKGTSALFANELITPEQKQSIEALFNEVGYTFWVDQESMLDTLTAPIGCAPAYVFLFLEALQKAAVSRGIPDKLAENIALESVLGAAELAKKSGRTFAQLRDGVSTPHGVTAHSLEKISFNDFFDLFKQIYAAAEERIDQIKKQDK